MVITSALLESYLCCQQINLVAIEFGLLNDKLGVYRATTLEKHLMKALF